MRDVARIEREISTWQSLEASLAENQELIELFIDDSTEDADESKDEDSAGDDPVAPLCLSAARGVHAFSPPELCPQRSDTS